MCEMRGITLLKFKGSSVYKLCMQVEKHTCTKKTYMCVCERDRDNTYYNNYCTVTTILYKSTDQYYNTSLIKKYNALKRTFIFEPSCQM